MFSAIYSQLVYNFW